MTSFPPPGGKAELEEGGVSAEELEQWMTAENPDFNLSKFGFQRFSELLNYAQDKTVVRAEPDKYHLCGRVIAHIVRVFANVDRFPESVGRAVKNADSTIASVRNIKLVDVGYIQRSLRLT